jgi:undecaprenyl diphosphate synthase
MRLCSIKLPDGERISIPEHIAIIPDGNRRWALSYGKEKHEGYSSGLKPGLDALRLCRELGVKEITYYGFTVDNTKRPVKQRLAFTKACVDAVKLIEKEDVELAVIGNTDSDMFPEELLELTQRTRIGKGGIRVNFLVNYSWEWDLKNGIAPYCHASKDVSRIDLVIRWGGMCRLSGLLPVQSVYADLYVVKDYWPNYRDEHILDALKWYNKQDITLGG